MGQARSLFLACICWLLVTETKGCNLTVYATLGLQSVIPCPLSSVINNTQWIGPPGNIPYNLPGTTILNVDELPADFLSRMAIHPTTGALIINNIQKSDENCYYCKVLTEAISVKLSIIEFYPVQTYVGSDANFSFLLTEDPNSTVVHIKDKAGAIVMSARGNVSESNNPLYKDRVNFTGNTYQKQISFILRNVTLMDAGIYTAVLSVINRIIGSQMLIVKAAPSKPQIVELEGHAVNGTNYHLNCSAQSNTQPPNHNLSMFSEWRKDDMLINSERYIVNGTELTITSIIFKQDNGSTLTCVAFEDQLSKSVNSDKFIMDVKYGPENSVNLGSIPPTLGVNLHQTAPDITCSATCNPPCDYRWYQNGTFFRNGATLSLGIVEKTTRGNYRCEAYTNVLGVNQSSSTSVNITIYFGAEIVNMSMNDNNTVNENSSAIFQCHVDSNPPSTITWMKESNSAVLKTESGVIQSQYRIESAQCLNMDNYTCSAYNGIWTPAKATMPLFVRCHPRTDYRIYHETKIYRRRYEAAVLRYTVISYPLPTFNWTFLGNGSESRYLPVSASQHNNGLQSELWFSSLGINDFGNYSVIADNSLPPSAREYFEIIPTEVSEVSSNVVILEITQTSVKVQWMAGNNGGLKQIFHVVVTAGSLVRNVTADDPGYRENGTVVLAGLVPKTKYSLFMIASNSVGSSSMREAILFTTLELITPVSGSSTFSLPAVAGGIGAGVVVILVAVVALFLWRRYHHRSQHTDDTQRNQINAKSVREDATNGQDYEGLHINNTEASAYLQLNDITLEENRNATSRPPENDSYEKLHPYTNNDIQMYSSLKIPKIATDSEKVYENTRIKATDLTAEHQ